MIRSRHQECRGEEESEREREQVCRGSIASFVDTSMAVASGYLKHRFRSQKQDPTFLRPDNTNLRIAAAESPTRTRTHATPF